MDCSGAIQKIHMRKIEVIQGLVNIMNCDRFHDQRTLAKAKWPSQGPGVRADAQCDIVHGSKNLFQRAILYRHKKIYLWQGRLQAISRRNYVYFCDGFSSISQDSLIRLGSRLLWHEILSVCSHGLQRGHPENPYEKDWSDTRSREHHEMWQISWSEDSS